MEKKETIQHEKHEKYLSLYKPNTIYWGLGIEEECYLEFTKKKIVQKEDFFNKRNRERYSIDYYSNYKKEEFDDAIKNYIDSIDTSYISIPILMNSHSFTKTDAYNHPKTLYTTLCEPNPNFVGETLIESLQRLKPYFRNTINKEWLFDGDTIEFNTLHFFNAKLNHVMRELEKNKSDFIYQINNIFEQTDIFKDYGSIKMMGKNHPFCSYMTNLDNIAMFNNGTLHYNITLPTELDENCKIKNMNQFIHDHSKAIKIIQWMEPFLISFYGSKDPLSDTNINFSKSSQRCAVSRYISIGTFNSDEMPKGKKLTIPVETCICNTVDNWWFHEYYKNNAYNKLHEIGYDINFNKHYNHGIELRFFDFIPSTEDRFSCFEFIIFLMDFILESDDINDFGNPILNNHWNDIVLNTMYSGSQYQLTIEQKELYERILKVNLSTTTVHDVYREIHTQLYIRYTKEPYHMYRIGKFSRCVSNSNIKKTPIQKIPKRVIKKQEKKRNCPTCSIM